MRYVLLVILSVVSVVLSGSVASGLNIAGIQVDIVLLIIVPLTLLEKTSMPIVFAAITGFLMDIMFSTVLGAYALCYTVMAAVCLLLFRKIIRFNVLSLFLVGAGSYLVKELTMAVIVYAQAGRYSFPPLLVRYILPAAVLNGVLLLVSYWLFSRVYSQSWMKTRAMRSLDDF